ncbi:MAG: hypothetical protein AB9866_09380 [Syntrophobacteraceae bacterium]
MLSYTPAASTFSRSIVIMLILVAALLGLTPALLEAQSNMSSSSVGSMPPVGESRQDILDLPGNDWTSNLNTSYGRSLDARGPASATAEVKRFVLNAAVLAFAVDGSGNLYAAGAFTTAVEVPVNHIAKWNGNEWSALGSGIGGEVRALAIDGSGNLYAGGAFTTAGGVAANHIAKWNGIEWSALGSGTAGAVRALAVDGNGNLYAVGDFSAAGGVATGKIAKWNGNEWSALGTGMDGEVIALAVDGSGNLYAGGTFTTAGGVLVNQIAKWDGSAWTALGSGIAGVVRALAVDGSGNLYAGGDFDTAGEVEANSIAKWNGIEWSILAPGTYYRDSVTSLAIDRSGTLHAGVLRLWVSDWRPKVSHVATWNGSEWSDRQIAEVGTVSALTLDESGNLYAGGIFSKEGWEETHHMVKWTGNPVLAVDFLSPGLCLWDGNWHNISRNHPGLLASWGNRLVMSFPASGLYLQDGSSRKRISTLDTAESVLGIADSLYVDFGTGVYRYRDGWTKIHTSNPTMMSSRGEKLVACFPDTGIWEYNGSEWRRINPWTSAEQMVGIEQRLFVDFGAKGIYRYDGSWVRTTGNNPALIHAFGTALVASIDSGSARGLYLYQNNSWKRVSSNPSAEGFASTPLTLYVDRGTQGISKYEKKTWKGINALNPDRISIYGGKLAASFPTKGLKLYSNPGWSSLSTNDDDGLMQGVLFE